MILFLIIYCVFAAIATNGFVNVIRTASDRFNYDKFQVAVLTITGPVWFPYIVGVTLAKYYLK